MKPMLLIIDADETRRSQDCQQIMALGMDAEIHSADDLVQAQATFASQNYDLVLINEPLEDGSMSLIQRLCEVAHQTLIFLTLSPFDESVAREACALGVDMVLSRDASYAYAMPGVVRSVLRTSTASARASEAETLCRHVFEQARDMMVVYRQDGCVLDANRSLCEALGYSHEELVGARLVDLVSPEHALRVSDLIGEIVDQGGLMFEGVYRHKNGACFPVEISASLIQIGEERVIQCVGRDTTAREEQRRMLQEQSARLAAEVEQSRERLQQTHTLATIGQMVGSVSHELRNPLGVLNNSAYYLSIILKDAEPMVAKHLRIMKREVDECRRITDELLSFAREPVIAPEQINLASLVDVALEKTDRPQNVRIEKVFNAERISAMVDSQIIVQVMVNLFTNAIQAMPDGGTLSISLANQPDGVAMMVQDSGVGMDQQTLSRIFDPLFTTKSKGTGLGLALSKRLIEAHGGKVSAVSEPDQGTTFRVWLPQ